MADMTTDSAPAAPSVGPAPRQAALTFIFVTVTLDMLALGMIAPVLPGLVQGFLGGSTERAAQIFGIFGTVWALMQFVFSPVLGSLSDRFGRRPVILLSNLGLGLDYLVMAVAPSLSWLLAGRVLSGITSASVPTAMAYIADVTPPSKRAAGFGMISAAFGLGFVLGPALGGLLGNVNPRLPFWVAGAFSLLNALYGLFVLPESLNPGNRSHFLWRKANPIGSFRLLRQRRSLFNLAIILFLGYIAHQVLTSTFVLYAAYRYTWNDRTVGLSLALVGVCSALVGAVLVKLVVARWGEQTAMFAGLLLGSLGFGLFGLASTGSLFLLGVPFMSLWGLAGPTAQGMMTRQVPPTEQGQLQGAINGLRGIAGLIGPVLFTFSFALAIDRKHQWQLPGLPFFLATSLLFCSLLLAYWTMHREHV